MAQASTLSHEKGFGATARRDTWWLGPSITVLGLSAFLIYGTWAAWQNGGFEIRQDRTDFHKPHNEAVAPYLSPFYSPLIYDAQSEHAWIKADLRPAWLPSWFPFSSGFLILAFPGLFRFTCYYYRKAYYRSFWADPIACGVGEPRKGYWGENRLPLILQNSHRYWMYFAVFFWLMLTKDALQAFWWPSLDAGSPTGSHQFGMGLGTLIMLVNIVLLGGFTFGCNSVRHLVGGRLNCFTCPKNPANNTTSYKVWRWSTFFNERHMQWAWASLFSVGFTDFYIRMCSTGVWNDFRFF